MKIDLRNIIKKENEMKKLSNNHRDIFEKKLKKELQQGTGSRFRFLKIAASILFLLSLGISGYEFYNNIDVTDQDQTKKYNSMADISPDLKKVEDYYLTHINYQLSKIKITDKNKIILDAYFVQLGELQEAYNNSIAELDSEDVSEETINLLIDNLQMRLKLMYQLKAQLEKIENLNKDENEINKA